MPTHDIIIVGAGIAGLYSAYQILKQSPDTSILILESGSRQEIGGRMGNDLFYGASIVKGAGVGRKKTDVLLTSLLKELGIKTHEFTVEHQFSPLIQDQVVDVNQTVAYLRKIYKSLNQNPIQTFREFATEHLGERLYRQFVLSTGYTDYEDADVYSVLYLYQMDNNASGWTAFDVPWSELIDQLKNRVGPYRIKTGQHVASIHYNECKFDVVSNTTNKTNMFQAKKVIVATRIDTVKRLFPGMHVYKQIQGQPFLYVYAKFNKESASLLKQLVPTYTVVGSPLQKIIPMSPNKGVYMIAYADNHNATRLKPYLDETRESNKRYFEHQMERALGLNTNTLHIIAFTSYYWKIGTHYCEPLDTTNYRNLQQMLNRAQHPVPGIVVVGEAVSAHQGWTEGALESVDRVLTRDWIQHPGF
jgi:L-2-hydroxyglutarate oxidase LhgO